MIRVVLLLLIALATLLPSGQVRAQVVDSSASARGTERAEATLDSLRADPALRYEVDPEQPTSLWDRFWSGIGQILRQIFGGNAGYFTRPILYGLMGLLLVWVIVLIARSDVRVLRRGGAAGGARGTGILPDDITREDYAALARQAEARGELRDALRWRFLDVLQRLDATGRSAYRPDKTHDAYAADLSGADQAPFLRVARSFERVWYGGYEVDASAYPAVREAALGIASASNPQTA